MLLLFFPLPVFADDLPKAVQEFVEANSTDATDAIGWTLSDVLDRLGEWVINGFQPVLRFAAKSAGYLVLTGLLGLLAGKSYSGYAEILSVLGFGSVSLSTVMHLTELVGRTAQDCRTYLTSFVPVFSGLAAAGGQTSGALVYSGMFFAMSSFLAALAQKILLPIMQIYFCFSVCACLWGNGGLSDAAALFSRCISWLLKLCATLFSMVLGLQNVLAATVDTAALRTGKSLLQGAIPVVGDAAAAALTGAAAALQLLKGSVALAALLALAAMFTPVFVQTMAYALVFAVTGLLAGAMRQAPCARLCRLYYEGARLCGSVLVLYFFIVFLSTALLLLAGNGGFA